MSDQQPAEMPQDAIDEAVQGAMNGTLGRRDFLRRVVVLGLSSAAAYKLFNETEAAAQSGKITTFAIGEEGSKPTPPVTKPSPNPPTAKPPAQQPTTLAVGEEGKPRPTTLAVGEESKPTPTTKAVGEENRPMPTTLAVGEESTVTTKAVGEETIGKPTTFAYGEEQNPYCPTPQPTTKAVGEESRPTPTTMRVGEEGTATTRAVGEESRPTPDNRPTTMAVGEETGSLPFFPKKETPKATTQAVGEEGSGSQQPIQIPNEIIKNLPDAWKGFRRW